ncbi:DUF3696 domain-containing protein [Leucothrix arctica]|uniref:DUF3696 domain-containing protein n=1 Tax=Leucothrix arctica TaxID=1481894 RepID=A0A317CC55_9GAMM|nr:DUF3696 domain-containing protein [Leucothrix arctica]PWQ93652.1 hypothetical protein DKT75_18740 [Leucothrix arctica]
MISKISLSNFKAFQEMNDLEIRDLTVIVGRNSCGKSSLMQSLLLLKQTLDSTSENPLCLEGKYLKFSNLKELSYGLPAVNAAKIGYDIFLDNTAASGNVKISYRNIKKDDLYTPQLSEFTTYLKKDGKTTSTPFLPMSKPKIKATYKKYSHFFGKESEVSLSESEVIFDKFMPESLNLVYKINKPNSDEKIRTLPLPILMASDDGSNHLILQLSQDLKNIRYLSPIRAAPKRAYVHYSQDVSLLNEDGSNSAHILWAKREHKVQWKKKTYKLIEAVNKCIKTIGLSQVISPDKVSDIVYKVGISESNSGSDVSLADVGFGYSQVLPIVLLGLLNSKENLMLIEQPEIHLHPSSAGNLADLFLGFVDDGKRFIIETHSQEFINKLRLRVIQNPELKSKINIVFVEQNEGESSTIKQFEIDEKGMFPEWPSGFIDESEKLAKEILKARMNSL